MVLIVSKVSEFELENLSKARNNICIKVLNLSLESIKRFRTHFDASKYESMNQTKGTKTDPQKYQNSKIELKATLIDEAKNRTIKRVFPFLPFKYHNLIHSIESILDTVTSSSFQPA